MVGLEDFEMPVSCRECIFHGDFGMCQVSGYFEDEDYTSTERSVDCPLVETYTKDDIVTMLTELLSEIEGLNMHGFIQLQNYRQKTGRYRQGF